MISAIPDASANEHRWRPETTSVFRRFLFYFVPLFFAITLLFAGLLVADYLRIASLINANEQLQVNTIRKTLVRDLEDIGPDLRILIQSEHLHEYLASPSVESKLRLEHTFGLIAEHKQRYDQIRFIDSEGQERVRVDYINGKAVGVQEDQLQDKSDRYYFRESSTLEQGDVFVSPLDLNIEHGQVEVPHKPVMRFATPVFDSTGHRRGIVILNYLAERMLRHFDEMLDGTWGHIEFLNQDGYWIRSHIKTRNWGFMLGQEQRFLDAHGDLWHTIAERDKGRVDDQRALYNFATVRPLATVRESIRFVPELGDVSQQTEYWQWKIVSDVPREVLTERLLENLVNISGPVWILLVIVLVVGSWRFAVNQVMRRRLQTESDLHAKVFSWTTEGVTITDSQGTILDVNSAFSRITGYSRDEVLGKNPRILSSGQHDKHFYTCMWTDIISHGFWEGEIYNRRKDGTLYCEWLRIATAFDHNKRVLNYIAVFSDISKKKETEQTLIRQALQDPLTGLGNRSALDSFLGLQLARARRTGNKIACLYFDLNEFKPINDAYGHAAGDAVLREISKRLSSHARETDSVARLGGDEFVVVLSDIVSREQVDTIVQRILGSLEQEIDTAWGSFTITVSMGKSLYPDDANDQESLIRYADKAMYADKQKKSLDSE